MSLQLLSTTNDNAEPNYTTFVVEVPGRGRQATRLVRTIRRLLPDANLKDSVVCDRQVTFTVVDIEAARNSLREELPELVALMPEA